jgi:hypothetical protein
VTHPRFLTDEDFNADIVDGAARLEPEIEFLSVRDTEVEGCPDAEVLQFAEEAAYIVLTHDENTMTKFAYERLAAGQTFPGVFVVHQWLPIGIAIHAIVLLWAASDAAEWRDHVEFLPL